ncbi:coiled-coil domain-containing protein 125-like isoform X1 [Mya arenaria]|uniref:coiled-coil domain-containing protein 125-like isoform X1 n=1 Tax=Mya arenaria TaxID=6604 RepID=UPI0022E09276|nr:coiled-coil domain-containing protein 125-like isoform X1 [Mya arenaria]
MSAANSDDDFTEADLGMGDGLKPGTLTIDPMDSAEFNTSRKIDQHSDRLSFGCQNCEEQGSDSEEEFVLMPISQVQQLKAQYSHLLNKSKRCSETNIVHETDNLIYDGRYFTDKCGVRIPESIKNMEGFGKSDKCKKDDQTPTFPVYADVPYGTSIRQQKELFKHNLEEIRKKNMLGPLDVNKNMAQEDEETKVSTSDEIAMKLASTLQEVEELRTELETCEQRLESKYKAIDILRQQAEEAQRRFKVREGSTREVAKKLAQVNIAAGDGSGARVSSLVPEEFDLGEMTSTKLLKYHLGDRKVKDEKPRMVSQEKYQRMCQENRELQASLEGRTDELRSLTASKMALSRENDELLALLDVQERARYEQTRSPGAAEESYGHFSSMELAVLGACRCRISTPDPCGCALAAANLKKDIVHLKTELSQYKARRDEAYHTVDAYRKAFDEQLQKNKALNCQLANLSLGRTADGGHTGKNKAKLALRWLIGSLNDDELSEGESSGCNMTEYELITYLTEMLNEKNEALAHQKLAAQILGDRVKTLETQFFKTTDKK